MIKISGLHTEEKRAKRWDADRECYLDPMGNIAIDSRTLDFDAMIQQIAEEEEYWQRKWWGGGEEKEKEKEEKSKKIDDGIIDTSQELNAENLVKIADKVLAAKELEFKCVNK
ncbi:hypothetical protein Hanom_Chr12g01098561 [Helianthus anomalus]